MNLFRLSFVFLFSLALVILPNPCARAEAGHDIVETQTILKTIGFIRGLRFNADQNLNIGIIYDPESTSSRNMADNILKEISKNPVIRKGRVIPSLASINAPLGGLQVYIVAPDTTRGYTMLRQLAKTKKSVTIGMGSDCARQNACALAVEKTQSIKIYLNESIFDQTVYDLDSTLRYLAVKL